MVDGAAGRRPVAVGRAVAYGFAIPAALALVGAGAALAIVRGSRPERQGEREVSFLRAPARIARDLYGIPHIRAEDDADAHFALGYAHAQDRLAQMEALRRSCAGRLAEWAGAELVELDVAMRTLEVERHARAAYDAAPEETRQLLAAYVAGVNEAIRAAEPFWPLELLGARVRPEPWRPHEPLCAAFVMSLGLGRNLAEEMLAFDLRDRLSAPELCALMPSAPAVDDACDADAVVRLRGAKTGAWTPTAELLRRLGAFRPGASNAWAVGRKRSRSGGAIVAGDPHLAVALPGMWYQARVALPRGHVFGVTLPGAPGFPIGENGKVAWSATNAMADQLDLVVLELDPAVPWRWRDGPDWRTLERVPVTIAVRDGAPVTRTVARSRFGPLLTAVEGATHAVALRWSAELGDDSATGFFRLAQAGDTRAALAALARVGVLGLRMVVGDREGRVGARVVGRLPRRVGATGRFPTEGSSGVRRWQGFNEPGDLPSELDPEVGFVVAANHRAGTPEQAARVGHAYAAPWRAERIAALLTPLQAASAEDLAAIQQDVRSRQADRLLDAIFAVEVRDEPRARRVQQDLRDWDRELRASRRGAAVWAVLRQVLAVRLLEDDLGPERFRDLQDTWTFNYTPLDDALLAGPAAMFFDDRRTAVVENPRDLLRATLVDVDRELERIERTLRDAGGLRWGALHTLTFAGPLARAPLLGARARRGPFPADGDGDTVNQGGFWFGRDFAVRQHASYRFVCDLGATPPRVLVQHPTGQSGQVLDPHYADWMDDWLAGRARSIAVDDAEVARIAPDTLVLRPRLAAAP